MRSKTSPPHRVVLVREWDQQMSGSGCCGRLGSAAVDVLSDQAVDPYARTRIDMERMGAIYRALRERFDESELELTVADPRNIVWLLPAIWRDARRRELPARSAVRQLVATTAPCTVVCDGLVLVSDASPDRAVAAVEADLARRGCYPTTR